MMRTCVKKNEIMQILKKLKTYYDVYILEEDQYMPFLISKVTIIEANGWMEEMVDCIMKRCLYKISVKDKNAIEEKIRKNYSVKYKNMRDLFCVLIGEKLFEIIENRTLKKISEKISNKKDINRDVIKSNINYIVKERDKLAHTYMSQLKVTKNIDSPHVIINKMKYIIFYLEEIEYEIYQYFINSIDDREYLDIQNKLKLLAYR